MFCSIPAYRVLSCENQGVRGTSLRRVSLRVQYLPNGESFDSMAEASTNKIATLFAISEVYEKICFANYRQNYSFMLNTNMPYGFGVGLRKKSSILRAYGEYWERSIFSNRKLCDEQAAGTKTLHAIQTSYGKIYICMMKRLDGVIGTGYGLSETLAEDSASRSAYRKIDYPQSLPLFKAPSVEPKVIRITPKDHTWLECHIVGFETISF